MNDDYTLLFSEEKLFEMYVALPENIKDAIFSVDGAGRIRNIGTKYGLNIAQIGELGRHTGMVMVGALHPRRFIQELEKRLNINHDKAAEIAKAVNESIFFPIREALRKIHDIDADEEVIEKNPAEKAEFSQKLADERRTIGPISQYTGGQNQGLGIINQGQVQQNVAQAVPKPAQPARPVWQPQQQQPVIPRPQVAQPTFHQPTQQPPQSHQAESGIKNQESRSVNQAQIQQNVGQIPRYERPTIKPLGSGSQALQEKFGKIINQGQAGTRPLPDWAKPKAESINTNQESKLEPSIKQTGRAGIRNQESSGYVQAQAVPFQSIPKPQFQPQTPTSQYTGQVQPARPVWQPQQSQQPIIPRPQVAQPTFHQPTQQPSQPVFRPQIMNQEASGYGQAQQFRPKPPPAKPQPPGPGGDPYKEAIE